MTVWHPLAADQTLQLRKKLNFLIATKYFLVRYEILTNNANIIFDFRRQWKYKINWLTHWLGFGTLYKNMFVKFAYLKVTTRSTCYYSGNQKFCIWESQLLTCRIYFWNKTFLIVKIQSWNFVMFHKILNHEDAEKMFL